LALLPAYETEAELKRDFDAVLPDLASDRSSSWEKQTAALDALTHMLSATESDATFVAVLGSPLLVRALVELLKSPRSALARHATSVVTKLTERLVVDQRWRRREAPDMLGALQQTLASRINVISECAREALVALAHTLPGSVLLPAIRCMCASLRDARLRRVGAELLAILLDRNGGRDVDDADASVVQALVVALLTDADPEARRNARAGYVAFCDAFPTLAPEIEAQLDPEARRVVERGGITTPRRQSPASAAVSPSQSASRLRQPSASARPSTTPRRLSNPPATPSSSASSVPRRESASTTSRIKPPTVFARPTSAVAAPKEAAAAAAAAATRKPNIRLPVTRKLFLGEDKTNTVDDESTPAAEEVNDVEEPIVDVVTPPQRSRSNSLEWFDSLTSSPAVKKPEGLLVDDVAINDFTPDDESLLRAAAAQLLAEQQAETTAESVPLPTPAPATATIEPDEPQSTTDIDDNNEPNEW
jgi:hypothetical protein